MVWIYIVFYQRELIILPYTTPPQTLSRDWLNRRLPKQPDETGSCSLSQRGQAAGTTSHLPPPAHAPPLKQVCYLALTHYKWRRRVSMYLLRRYIAVFVLHYSLWLFKNSLATNDVANVIVYHKKTKVSVDLYISTSPCSDSDFWLCKLSFSYNFPAIVTTS